MTTTTTTETLRLGGGMMALLCREGNWGILCAHCVELSLFCFDSSLPPLLKLSSPR